MERLTNKREADLQRKRYEKRLEQGYPRNIPEERFLLLAAYEDTGLTPEQVAAMKTELQDERYRHDRQADFTVGQGQEIDRLKALVAAYTKAEKEGRIVVLPCGPGAELTRGGETFKADHWNVSLTAFREEPGNGSGRQVALFSVEEAKSALEGGAAK